MTIRQVSVIAICSIACLQSASAAAQSWDNVRQLAPGARLSVAVTGRAPVTRWFVAANDSELLVNDDAGTPHSIARSEVAELRIMTKKDFDFVSRTMRPLVLIGVGAGAGLGVAYCANHTCDTPGWVLGTYAYAAVGALIGSTAGVVVAVTRDNSRVIYRAP